MTLFMVPWDLKARRSGNGSIPLLWFPANWGQNGLRASCASAQWSKRRVVCAPPLSFRWPSPYSSCCLCDGTSPDTQHTYFVVYLEPLMLNLGNVSHLRAECAGRSSWRVRAGNKNVEEVKFLWDNLAFGFCMNYTLSLLMFMCQPSLPQKSLWHNFTTTSLNSLIKQYCIIWYTS